MREILEFQGRLKPVMELTVAFSKAENRVLAVQDVVYNVQMATYWLKEAADHLYATQSNTEDIESPLNGAEIFPPETPNIKDPELMLVGIFDILNKLMTDLFNYTHERGMDKMSEFMLDTATARVNEAKYSIVIAKLQHERLQTAGKLN